MLDTIEIRRILVNKLKARYYNCIIKISFYFKLPILENFLLRNIKYKNKKNILWYLDYKRSPAEINFFLEKNYNLLLVNILLIKELILFLEIDKDHTKKKYVFKLLNKIGVKLIVSPAIHYKVNLLGYIGSKFKIKFLVYHRECYNFSKLHLNGIKNYLRQNKKKYKFIDNLIVHNEIYKKKFIKYAGIDKSKINVIGPLRFDKLKDVKINQEKKIRNRIIFFAFTPLYSATFDGYSALRKNKSTIFGDIDHYLNKNHGKTNNIKNEIYFYDHVIEALLIFIGNAFKFPKIKFEIKLKWEDKRWNSIINKVIDFNFNNYPSNLEITADKNYWDKITKSFLICGYGSTALLEASHLNVPSAQIICGELNNKKNYRARGRLHNHAKSFFIIKKEKDLTDLILKRHILSKSLKIKSAKEDFYKYIANTKNEKLETKFQRLINKLIY